MKTTTSQITPQSHRLAPESERAIWSHLALLGHDSLGVTELRVFEPRPQVAYADSVDDVVRLCRQMDDNATGIYVGVQPRPAHLFDQAPNRWVPAHGGHDGNCARDVDIEYITALFFDIDVVSPQRAQGHPASQEELRRSLHVAERLARQDGLALSSTLCCSGNGHYVLASISLPFPLTMTMWPAGSSASARAWQTTSPVKSQGQESIPYTTSVASCG